MSRVFRASVFTNQKEHWRYRLMSEVYPDGTFEVLPILQYDEPLEKRDFKPHVRKHLRTYADVPSWHQPNKSVAAYIKHKNAAGLVVHDDPDLHTLMAYGDIRERRNGKRSIRGGGLFTLKPGDYLLFIAHLAYAERPGEPNAKHAKTGWYLVGCLKSTHVEFAGAGRQFSDRVKGHAHWLWGQYDDLTWGSEPHNMIACGHPKRGDQRFEFAVPILTRKDAIRLLRDKHGQPVDPSNSNQTVKSAIGSYTRTGRCIGDAANPDHAAYLYDLREAILDRNSSLADLLW